MLTRLTASLADVCFSSGQEDQAKRFYLELVASDPTNELYRERLAELDGCGARHRARGIDVIGDRRRRAFGDHLHHRWRRGDGSGIDEPEPVIPEGPSFDPTERINEAAVFAKYGLNDKAISHLEEVVDRLPDHAGAREALAKIYLAAGQQEEAASHRRTLDQGMPISR